VSNRCRKTTPAAAEARTRPTQAAIAACVAAAPSVCASIDPAGAKRPVSPRATANPAPAPSSVGTSISTSERAANAATCSPLAKSSAASARRRRTRNTPAAPATASVIPIPAPESNETTGEIASALASASLTAADSELDIEHMSRGQPVVVVRPGSAQPSSLPSSERASVCWSRSKCRVSVRARASVNPSWATASSLTVVSCGPNPTRNVRPPCLNFRTALRAGVMR
jgi:hypothetical protein